MNAPVSSMNDAAGPSTITVTYDQLVADCKDRLTAAQHREKMRYIFAKHLERQAKARVNEERKWNEMISPDKPDRSAQLAAPAVAVEHATQDESTEDEIINHLVETLPGLSTTEEEPAAKSVADLLPPVPVEKLINPVSQSIKSQIAQAMGKAPATSVGPEVTARDLATLTPGTWLNDEIVNSYVKAAVKSSDSAEGATSKRFATLNSNWWNTINNKNYSAGDGIKKVQRWAKRAKINGEQLLKTDNVFIPINYGAHWTLLAISGTEKRVEYLNSLAGAGAKDNAVKDVVWQYLTAELGSKFNSDEWEYTVGRSSQQNNGNDCGVFVCFNALSLVRGLLPTTAFGASDMLNARQQVAATLMSGVL